VVPDAADAKVTSLDLPEAEPFVRLEKARFAEGEEVFFWVGVRGTNKPGTPTARIPKEFRGTCRLTVTRPDGVQRTDPVSWPLDGPEGSTWQGGAGLREPAIPGRYTVVFEFAGKKSAPSAFVVERAPILQKIHAAFVFDASSSANAVNSPDTPVTLIVRNGSDQTVRFPYRGGRSRINGSDIWVHFSGLDKMRGGIVHVFYPSDKVPGPDPEETGQSRSSYDTFTWQAASRVSAVVLMPGETYRLSLSLRYAIAEARKHSTLAPGPYDVRFGTTLSLLIGEPEEDLTGLFPVRVVVEGSAACTVPAV
jgi:hypothetical protein